MPYGVYLSASGAHAQSHRMKMLSNNLANVDTPGFKPQETILQARFAELIEEGDGPDGLGGADDIGGGVTIQKAQTEFALGPMKTTGRETDFAIQDPHSFFVLNSPEGEQVLTRAGDFQFDAQGMLVGQSGQHVMGSDGKSIQLNPNLPYSVGAEGRITQGQNVWELMLGKPKSMGDISHLGGNEFKPLADFDLVPPNRKSDV